MTAGWLGAVLTVAGLVAGGIVISLLTERRRRKRQEALELLRSYRHWDEIAVREKD